MIVNFVLEGGVFTLLPGVVATSVGGANLTARLKAGIFSFISGTVGDPDFLLPANKWMLVVVPKNKWVCAETSQFILGKDILGGGRPLG
jgi:hypothetical protein